MASKCACEISYDTCVANIESSLKTNGSVVIKKSDTNDPCNNKMIQQMFREYLNSFVNDSNYRVHEETFYTFAGKRVFSGTIGISDKRIFG
jgi:hypothetical protein